MHKRKPESDETQKMQGQPADKGTEPRMPDGIPRWEVGDERSWSFSQSGGPGNIYHQTVITMSTNDKEWMHRNMDLHELSTEFNKRFDTLISYLGMFAVGMVAMGGLIWILG